MRILKYILINSLGYIEFGSEVIETKWYYWRPFVQNVPVFGAGYICPVGTLSGNDYFLLKRYLVEKSTLYTENNLNFRRLLRIWRTGKVKLDNWRFAYYRRWTCLTIDLHCQRASRSFSSSCQPRHTDHVFVVVLESRECKRSWFCVHVICLFSSRYLPLLFFCSYLHLVSQYFSVLILNWNWFPFYMNTCRSFVPDLQIFRCRTRHYNEKQYDHLFTFLTNVSSAN